MYSHIAWLRTIKDKKGMKNVEVTFPLIEDITMEMAKMYGMLQPSESTTKAVRAYVHREQYRTVIRKNLVSRNIQVITLSVLFFLVTCTGLIPWFIHLSGGGQFFLDLF